MVLYLWILSLIISVKESNKLLYIVHPIFQYFLGKQCLILEKNEFKTFHVVLG